VVRTKILDTLTADQIEYMTARIPLGRTALPEEVAAAVSWLLSDEASFTTGSVLDLSGGRATY
jgi:3-oxoacyl-[acyl-carrier protein] reductase